MRLILFIVFFLCISAVYSQVIITDLNNDPIPFVQVVSNNKSFFAQSNLKGELNWIDIKKLNPIDTLFFHHISHEKAHILVRELSPSDTIKLKQQLHNLQEFSVASKEKKNKFQTISACYRAYQANNDSVAFYLDGKAKYLSKINSGKFDLHLKEHRAFANKKIEDETPHRNVGVSFEITIPRPPFYFLPLQFDKKNSSKYIVQDSSKTKIFERDSILVGKIEKSKDYIKYNIVDLGFIGTNKMAKTEVDRIKCEIIMVFRNKEGLDLKSIKNFDDLLYAKILREYKVKHDKDKIFTKIFQVEELFIENVTYSSTADKKVYNSSSRMPDKSSYSVEFWETCNCAVYYPPINQIIKNLYER